MIFPSVCWWTTSACIRGGEAPSPRSRRTAGSSARMAILIRVQFRTDSFNLIFQCKVLRASFEYLTRLPVRQAMRGLT